MGLLDDLQSEVKKRKADELKQNVELQAQEDFYNAQLQPVMLQAYDYFSEIVESLQIVAPDIRPSYPFEPLQKQGISFHQSDYEFDFDSAKNPRQINIYCTCTLERPLEFLERLARLLLREESKLVEVQVCDDVRDELRRQVEEDKRRNEEDLAQAYEYIEAERLAEEDARLINRTKRAMTEGVDKVSKAIKKLK
jgi:hypothetical protein